MAEVAASADALPQTSTADADRAARVQGVINAILANPTSQAAIQAAMMDPEVGEAALKDGGTAVLLAALGGAQNELAARQLRELQPTNDERARIAEAAAPEQLAALPSRQPAASEQPVVVAGAADGAAAVVATAPVPEQGAAVAAAGAGAEISQDGAQALAGGLAATVSSPAIPSALIRKTPPGPVAVSEKPAGSMSKA